MYGKPPPRAIEELVNFPANPEYQFDNARFYSKIAEQVEKKKEKYHKIQPKAIRYHEGEKVLIRNRELPSSREGITKKLLLLYNGPYIIVKDNHNNTYVVSEIMTKRIKGTYNQSSLKKYYEAVPELSLIHI